MIYFELQDTPALKNSPRLKDWYGKFDVRDIRLDSFLNLPEMQLFTIEDSDDTTFTDIILFPFLLISPMFHDVIKMYRDRCFFRTVILLDPLNEESRLYYLPVLDETHDIQLRRIEYKDGKCISGLQEIKGDKIELERNIFWVQDTKKRHIVLSMDIAESLIRRETTGLSLCEVELYRKD